MKSKKNLWLLLCVVALSLGVVAQAQAQKKLKSGVITYELIFDSDDPTEEMLQDMEVKLYFMGKKSRMDMTMLGGLLTMKIISDIDHPDEVKFLFDMMGQKLEVAMPKDEAAQLQMLLAAEGEATLTREKKKIVGYKCRKAIVRLPEGSLMEYWLAKKINPDENVMTAQLPELSGRGMPLEFTVNQEGVELQFRAVAVSGEVDPSDFEVPEDYRKITPEELLQLLEQ